MDVAAWLKDLGLDRYRRAFLDQAIEAEVLPDLTEADLEKLGVLLGHRKRLLRAIAALGGGSAAQQHPTVSASRVPPAVSAERRQLTVMFVDLVGSTELSARLDPEQMREVIRAYQNAVAGEIARFEGHVAKFMGDGVLAYFGWPRAHEDAAERAVRAALAVAAAVGGLSTPAGRPLTARVGIATGLVVVGDLIGEGAAQEEAVIGETPNLAFRLQGLADPGRVVIAEGSRRLLGELFDLEDLGPQRLRGLPGTTPAYLVRGERKLESRFAARRTGGLGPIVGRAQELALLLERWRLVKAGEGQAVLLVGEAGIGKSRIAQAVIDAVMPEAHVRIGYQCSPYHTDSALYPAIQQLQHAAGLSSDETAERKLDKLEALLARAGTRADDAAPLVAALIGLDGEARYGPLKLTPQQRRARTLQILVDQLLGLARQQPVLVVVEDAHWIDATTLELIELALDRIACARALFLLTARPTFQHGFGGHPIVTRLTLNRLGREQVVAIVTRVTGGKTLPPELLAEIAARTDGVPLFVEEMTRAVLDSGLVREAEEGYRLVRPLSTLTIPTSLHDSLMARLDRSRPVKEVAQAAAVIGRSFDHRLLKAICPLPEAELGGALDRLVEAELIFRRGTPPEAAYTFKHALVRDAAYESLLISRRRALHALLLEALEAMPDVAPEILAHHATEAGQVERAIEYWRQAGERSLRSYANQEATGFLRQAIELTGLRPAGAERDRAELGLLLSLAPATRAIKGHAARETLALYSRARELIGSSGSTAEQLNVIYGLWGVHFVRAKHHATRQWAERAWTLAAAGEQHEPQAWACRLMGESLWPVGELTEARAWLERALAVGADRAEITDLRYSHDHRVTALLFLAPTLLMLGQPDSAQRAMADSVARADGLGHPPTLGMALWSAGMLALMRRDVAETADLSTRAVAQCAEHGVTMFGCWASFCQGWASFRQGDAERGMAAMRAALAQADRAHAVLYRPMHLGYLAEACAASGETAEGFGLLNEAVELAVQTGERVFEAELHRLRGDLLLSAARTTEAEAAWQHALVVARRQSARLWELRAATSLARLLAEQGKRQEAQDLLTPIQAWFTEGLGTADLLTAKDVLASVA